MNRSRRTPDRTIASRRRLDARAVSAIAVLTLEAFGATGCGANPAKGRENAPAPAPSAQPVVTAAPTASAPPMGVNYLGGDEHADPCAPPCTGECTPPLTTGVMLPTPRVDPGGRCLETIASGQNTSRPIVVAGGNAYIGNWDSVASVPIHGGAVLVIAADQKRPTAIAIDGKNVYWTNPARAGSGSFKKTDPDYGATVVAAPLGGGIPRVLTSDQKYPEAIAVDAMSVYWTNLSLDDRGAGAVMKVPLAGGSPTVLAAHQNMPMGLAVLGKFVFWTADGKLKRVSVDGGAPTVVSPADESVGGDIALDANNIYCFATHDQPMTARQQMRGETPDTRLLKVPLDGSPPTVLATNLYSPHGVTIDGSTVYWLDSGVMKVPIGGGTVETIGGEKEIASGIAVDGTSVYWTSFGGAVKRLTPK